MLQELRFFDPDFLHVCYWTLPSILVGVIMAVLAAGHSKNQKKRQKDFEDEMSKA